ncbi:hypothetical protein M0D68_28490 [Paraburkholderia sp. SEWSISQ10-3 4]|uniref:hypothetical protein n=1 Tax=Paraburkholderia TaxID=1822464 RepID=UPI002252532B|nr:MULTISPECIES: hypothetical protein [Paraburkholderia]MCX4142158.1 hypothetical protein [Paraburkholderia aspalathi]MDN7174838.1 hypothetical protein [Paraburkholderia sp. SEWSISQ10-3 4]MDQ6504479.1 hypothetical protein [Paraburkholderia aspalathi]
MITISPAIRQKLAVAMHARYAGQPVKLGAQAHRRERNVSSYARATELIKVASATRTIGLTPRSKQCISATDCLRQFFDLTYACCFGPRTHGVTIATLRDPANARTWSQAFRLQNQGPIERHHTRLTATLGATAGGWRLAAGN